MALSSRARRSPAAALASSQDGRKATSNWKARPTWSWKSSATARCKRIPSISAICTGRPVSRNTGWSMSAVNASRSIFCAAPRRDMSPSASKGVGSSPLSLASPSAWPAPTTRTATPNCPLRYANPSGVEKLLDQAMDLGADALDAPFVILRLLGDLGDTVALQTQIENLPLQGRTELTGDVLDGIRQDRRLLRSRLALLRHRTLLVALQPAGVGLARRVAAFGPVQVELPTALPQGK